MLFSSSVVFVLFTRLLLISQSNGARILVTGAVDSGTHIGSMVPMVKRLASSGHQIVVLEIATLKKARNLGTNVTVLFIPVPEDGGIAASLSASMFRVVSNGRILHLPYLFGDQKVHEYILSHAPMFRSLLNTAFDLVILDELFGVHSFAIAVHLNRHYGVPYIIYSTTMMIQSSAYSLALGRNFVSEPNLLTSPPASSGDRYDPTNILDRLDNLNTVAWDLLRVKLHVESHLQSSLSSLRLFSVPNFAFSDFFSKASFVFADYLDRVPAPLAESPSILPVSSHCGRARPLPSDLANFVSHFSSKGTIYVAFGTNLQWRYAPKGILNAFFGALNRLVDYRIIFSFNNGIVPNNISVGTHIKLVTWAPQFDVLSHPATKLFISHSGLKSFKETLCTKVPAVYMPVYAEQSYNSKLALRFGFATAVHKVTLDEEVLYSAIQKILSNYSHFKDNANRAHAFFLDRALDGMQMAEYGVRRALKEGGRGRRWKMTKGMDLDWFSYVHLDVAASFIALALFLAKA